jgi:nitrite reductase/ring-hydroxylating ferredoxin subunit
MPETERMHGGHARDEAVAIALCAGTALVDGGPGVRFDLEQDLGKRWVAATGFVVRHQGRVHAYLNECRHVPSELDWQPGRFFDAAGLYLICATHGAMYRPEDGLCIQGPCAGQRLIALRVEERDGQVLWLPDSRFRPVETKTT